MAVKGGPDIITEGLVFHLDAAARNKSYPVNGLDVEYLVVAGGGGSAKFRSGGGGAGGLLHGYTTLTTSVGTYPIVIGGGGTHNASSVYTIGSNGSNTTFNDLEAIGGGAGSYYIGWASSGGSGGGNSHYCCGIPIAIGVPGQGHDGGLGRWWGQSSAGGGGAGEAGYIAGNAGQKAGKGGDGLPFNIEGYTKYYAGGGAGGTHRYNDASTWSLDNVGGLGGGGDSGQPSPVPNSGGGSGGSTHWNSLPSNGSSGIVVIRYKGPKKATGGDSVYTSRGYTVHVFTSSGTFTVGNKVAGLSTNKIVGTLTNMDSSNFNSGNRGYFSFDGSNERILLSQVVSGSHKTIIFWVYVTQTLLGNSTGGQGPIMSSQDGQTIWLGNFSSAAIDEVLNIFSASRFTFAKGPIYAGWRNICFRWNNSYYDIFIDGVQTTSYIGPPANLHCPLLSNAFVEIGARSSSSQYFSGRYQSPPPGQIANMSIYNISLSDNEVLDNYNATKGRYGL